MGELERDRDQRPERGRLTVVDRSALKRIGLSFGALAVTVTLIAAAVVTQHTDGQPTFDRAEAPTAVASTSAR
jgi:hypothetical protein